MVKKTKPDTFNPSIKGNCFLHTYFKQFSHLYIDPTSYLIQYFLDNLHSFQELNCPRSQPFNNIFIHECIECQTNKNFPFKHNIAPRVPFFENATHFNYRISMDTKGPISPTSNGNFYIVVIIDASSHFIITNPSPNINCKHAIHTLLYHWITKFGPPQYLVTDRGTECINQDMAHLC